jgi:hypothetical protein
MVVNSSMNKGNIQEQKVMRGEGEFFPPTLCYERGLPPPPPAAAFCVHFDRFFMMYVALALAGL